MNKNKIFFFLLLSLSICFYQCKWDPIELKEHCGNSIQDADETGVDCGGATCEPCTGSPSCNNNNVQDNGETGVDCGGGGCAACGVATELCDNGVQDPGEDGVDCGCDCPTKCFPTFEKTYSLQAVQFSEGIEQSNGDIILGGSVYIGSLNPFDKDNFKGILLGVDREGATLCKREGISVGNGENHIFGINKGSNDEVVAVGFSQPPNGFDASVLLVDGTSSCNTSSVSIHNNPTADPSIGEEFWEQGDCIIIDRNDQAPVVSGKWKGYPSLTKYQSSLTGDILWQQIYDADFFLAETSETLALAWNGSQSAGHTGKKTIQLASGGFMTTGYVVFKNGADLIRAPYLIKSRLNGGTDWVKIYSTNAIGASIFGRKHAEGLDLLEVGGKVIMAGYGFDELPNVSDPNDVNCADFIGFIAQVDPSNGNLEAYEEILNSGGIDIVNALVKGPLSNQFVITGITQVDASTATHGMVIEDYFVTTDPSEFPDGDIEAIYSKAGDIAGGNDIIATTDGGYLIIGSIGQSCNGPGDLYLVKTNSLGEVCN